MWCGRDVGRPPLLQMHTTVEQPLTPTGVGRITCHPIGQEPMHFLWASADGHLVQLANNDSEAVHLPPGRYSVDVEDATMRRASAVVDIVPRVPDAVCIERYDVTPASTQFACDGSVRAVGHGTARRRYLWSNGVVTQGELLQDVPCGTYVAVPIPDEAPGAPVPTALHTAEPGRVGVRPGAAF